MSFTVDAHLETKLSIDVRASNGEAKNYVVPSGTQQDFSTFFLELSGDFGTRVPHVFEEPVERPAAHIAWRPLLTENLNPQILVGYGDPAVFRDGDDYWLVCTSNDAPDAFPILHSKDLEHWEPCGFVFHQLVSLYGQPRGRNTADFCAPEMHRVDEEFWLAFTARQATNALAIGLARAPSPLGPWI
jgi:hypothetical protein